MSSHDSLSSSSSGFYHTALDSLMDTLFISSTPNLEPSRQSSRLRKYRSFPSSNEEEMFYTVRSSKSLGRDNKDIQATPNEDAASGSPTSSTGGDTPKRIVPNARKQRLFSGTESEDFLPRTRITNVKELTPQSQLLRKAIIRMECLQRRQERIALSKKPARTSLRV